MSNVSTAPLDPEAQELINRCDRAHATLEHAPGRLYSTLRNIVVYGMRFTDHVAGCDCRDLALYAFAGYGYTVCAKHGCQSLGLLRREIINPAKTTRKAGRR